MTLFALLGVVLTLIAVAIPVITLLRSGEDDNAPISATVVALTIPTAVLVLYLFVSNHDWQEPSVVAAETSVPPDMQTAVASLEAKLRDDPGDIDAWLLLGNSYIQMQQFDAAIQAFNRSLELRDDRRARLGLAEATVLQDRSALTGPAGQVFEDVLAEEPLNARALFYAGMVAVAREDDDLVRRRWGRLLELSPPENVRRILEQQLELLEPAGVEGAPVVATGSPTIKVAIDVVPSIREQINRGDSLFVLARVPNQPGPPIAAVRLNVQTFPLTVEISDANVMMPGRSLNDADKLEIAARVSKSGNAISEPGDVFGNIIYQRGSSETNQVDVLLDRIVGGS